MITNPYRSGSTSSEQQSIYSTGSTKTKPIYQRLCSKSQVILIVIGITIITFFLYGHSTDELLMGSNSIALSLRGSSYGVLKKKNDIKETDDPIVLKDRMKLTKTMAPISIKPVNKDKINHEVNIHLNEDENKNKNVEKNDKTVSKKKETETLTLINSQKKIHDQELAKALADAASAKAELQHMKEQQEKARADEISKQRIKEMERVAQADAANRLKQNEAEELQAHKNIEDHSTGMHSNNGKTASLPVEYKNPFDPKPGHQLRTRVPIIPPKIVCDGSMDPFSGQSVEGFEPPSKASMKNKLDWKGKVHAMVESVRHKNIGGQVLRDFVAAEVQKLELLRIDLFCEPFLKEHSSTTVETKDDK